MKIPEDVSVVGFDDVEDAKHLVPALTTMHIPKFDLGRASCSLLDEQFANPEGISKIVCLNAYLVERDSVEKNI